MTNLEFLALENVAVSATRLAWPAGDGGVETAGSELCLEQRIDLGLLLLLIKAALSMVRALDGLGGGINGRFALLGDGLCVLRVRDQYNCISQM